MKLLYSKFVININPTENTIIKENIESLIVGTRRTDRRKDRGDYEVTYTALYFYLCINVFIFVAFYFIIIYYILNSK